MCVCADTIRSARPGRVDRVQGSRRTVLLFQPPHQGEHLGQACLLAVSWAIERSSHILTQTTAGTARRRAVYVSGRALGQNKEADKRGTGQQGILFTLGQHSAADASCAARHQPGEASPPSHCQGLRACQVPASLAQPFVCEPSSVPS